MHHRAVSLIQLRYRLLLQRKRKLQRIVFWTPFLQTNVRGFLAKMRFHKVRRVQDSSRDRAAIIIQRHWRVAKTARKKFQESYQVLRARLQAEKAAYALILKEIKEKEARATTMSRPVTHLSRHKKSRQTPCVLPRIPMVQSAPCVPRPTSLPRVKPPPSLPKPQPTPPPQMTVCLDQYKSLTDTNIIILESTSLEVHPTCSSFSISICRPERANILLQAAKPSYESHGRVTDRLTVPLSVCSVADPGMPPICCRPLYHM